MIQVIKDGVVRMEAILDDQHWVIRGLQSFNVPHDTRMKRMPYTFSLDGMMALAVSYEREVPNVRDWGSWARIASRL